MALLYCPKSTWPIFHWWIVWARNLRLNQRLGSICYSYSAAESRRTVTTVTTLFLLWSINFLRFIENYVNVFSWYCTLKVSSWYHAIEKCCVNIKVSACFFVAISANFKFSWAGRIRIPLLLWVYVKFQKK